VCDGHHGTDLELRVESWGHCVELRQDTVRA
jgi:hypothetical protein